MINKKEMTLEEEKLINEFLQICKRLDISYTSIYSGVYKISEDKLYIIKDVADKNGNKKFKLRENETNILYKIEYLKIPVDFFNRVINKLNFNN